MFDSICVRQTAFGNEPPLDVGLLAEALLFYERVVLILNRAVFVQLLDTLGPEGLLRLVDSHRVSCSYCNQFTGVSTEDVGGPSERFFLGIAEMPHTAIDQLAAEEFRRITGKSGRGRRLADRFLQHVDEVRLDPTISESATADALDAAYASRLVRDGLRIMSPGYQPPTELAFELEPLSEGRLTLRTNLELEQVNRVWRFGSDQQITAAHLLGWILTVHEEFAFSGSFASEMVTNPFSSSLLRVKTEELLARERSAAVQGEFQDLVCDGVRSVREAVNSRERSLLDALELAEHGQRFRDWTSTIDVDLDLVREYLRACTRDGLLDQLPAKAVRFLVVTGGGTAAGLAVTGPIGVAAGPVLGAIDFLADVLRRGWRPSQFVEGRLREFVGD